MSIKNGFGIEPANYCNLSCPHCPTGRKLIDKTYKRLTISEFKSYIDSLIPELMYLNLYFQGEPFLNKDLPEMIKYADERGVFTCVSTNGNALTEDVVKRLAQSGIGRLIICLDGAPADSYSKYRVGGDFSKVINGISLSVKYGLPVEVQCLLLSTTENEIEEIKSLCKTLGVKRLNSLTNKLKNSRFAYVMHFSNRSWLRSFRSPWGLGEKIARIPLFFLFCEHELPYTLLFSTVILPSQKSLTA